MSRLFDILEDVVSFSFEQLPKNLPSFGHDLSKTSCDSLSVSHQWVPKNLQIQEGQAVGKSSVDHALQAGGTVESSGIVVQDQDMQTPSASSLLVTALAGSDSLLVDGSQDFSIGDKIVLPGTTRTTKNFDSQSVMADQAEICIIANMQKTGFDRDSAVTEIQCESPFSYRHSKMSLQARFGSLLVTALAGSDSLLVEGSLDLKSGDEVVLPDTRKDLINQTERCIISSMKKTEFDADSSITEITCESPFSYRHNGWYK